MDKVTEKIRTHEPKKKGVINRAHLRKKLEMKQVEVEKPTTRREAVRKQLRERLFPYQKRWINDRANIAIAVKSRRIGFTWATSLDAVMNALDKENGGNVLYVTALRENVKPFLDQCRNHLNVFKALYPELAVYKNEDGTGSKQENVQFEIRLASGNKITGKSGTGASFRGYGNPGELAILDEFAFIPDNEELLEASGGMTMGGGRVKIISTHFGKENLFNEKVEQAKRGEYPASLHTVTLDDALRDGFFKKYVAVYKKVEPSEENELAWRDEVIKSFPDPDQELFCIPTVGEAQFMSNDLVDSGADDLQNVVDWKPPCEDFVNKDLAYKTTEILSFFTRKVVPILNKYDNGVYIGYDIARSGDLSVIALGEKTDKQVKFDCIELSDCPFDEQESLVLQIVDYLKRQNKYAGATIDATGMGAHTAENLISKHRIPNINAVNITSNIKKDIFTELKAGFEEKRILIPNDHDTKSDFCALTIDTNKIPTLPKTRKKGKRGFQRHGDSAVAVALAFHAAKEDKPAVAPVVIKGDIVTPQYANPAGTLAGFGNADIFTY